MAMADKLEAIEKTVNEGRRTDEVIVINDSNGKYLKPELLHHEKKVTMEEIFTLAEIPEKIPERDEPELVKDIVFNTALNDIRDHRTSVETVVKRQKEACHLLHHRFKNARFHIVATPPLTQRQRDLNRQMEDYATSAGISYVSNDAIVDQATGDIKLGMMKGIHYTPLGTKMVATQLKRSLYANEPLQNALSQQHRQRGPRQPVMHHQGQSLLRPTYMSQQRPQSSMPNYDQRSNQTPTTIQHDAENVIEQMSALLQKWQRGPNLLQ